MKALIRYVRNKKNQPIGAVVATGASNVGWSLCCKKDKFDRKIAIMLAMERAYNIEKLKLRKNFNIPHTVKKAYEEMQVRAQKYFLKDTREVDTVESTPTISSE